MIGETQILPIIDRKFTLVEAIQLCDRLGDSWRMPSIAELHLIYEQQRGIVEPLCYWSKTEYLADYGLYFNFSDDVPRIMSSHKGITMNLILIRNL